MEPKKYRYELKFILNSSHAEILKHRLSLVMKVDTNSINDDNTYFIRSLYFDDIKDTAYYEKIDGNERRKKYRIRIYNFDDSFIRLERKDKNRDLTHKVQINITKKECLALISGDYNKEMLLRDDLLGEFVREMETKRLIPSVIVDYKRLAYIYPVEDTRVTFDENIKSGRFNYDLFSKEFISYNVLEENETVLEVKFNNVIPKHIAKIIMTIPTVRQAVSKFAICREKKEV